MVVGACSSMMLTEVSVNPKVVTSADSVVSFGASEVALAVLCSDNRSSYKQYYSILSSGSMNEVRSRALARNCVSSKSPSRVPDGEKVVTESNKREQNTAIDFFTKSKQK